MKKVSIVIPVYRNVKSLPELFIRISNVIDVECHQYEFEFIFVDDGSDDGSFDELLKFKLNRTNVVIIRFSRNFGQVAALTAGYRAATGEAVISLSADLQEPIEMIPQIIQEWNNGHDIVICYRKKRNDGFVRNVTSRIFYKLIKISNPLMPAGGFDFLLLGRKALDEFNKIRTKNRFFQGDVLWLGFDVKFLPYERAERKLGQSQWSLTRRMKYFTDGILNTAYWPIRLMSIIGVVCAILGFSYAGAVLYARLLNQTPFKGYAPIVILILIIGGFVMIMLGIIGEYICRIYDELKGNPSYVIKDIKK